MRAVGRAGWDEWRVAAEHRLWIVKHINHHNWLFLCRKTPFCFIISGKRETWKERGGNEYSCSSHGGDSPWWRHTSQAASFPFTWLLILYKCHTGFDFFKGTPAVFLCSILFYVYFIFIIHPLSSWEGKKKPACILQCLVWVRNSSDK